jgi:hypothetical protein
MSGGWINSWPAVILLGVIAPPVAILLIAQLFGAWIPDYQARRHRSTINARWQEAQIQITLLEHTLWPDKTPDWYGHEYCNCCAGGHTHSISTQGEINKAGFEAIEVTALGQVEPRYVPGGPVRPHSDMCSCSQPWLFWTDSHPKKRNLP